MTEISRPVRVLRIAALTLMLAATQPDAADERARDTVRTLAALDARVFRIGTPIARAAAPLCAEGWSTGLLVQLASQYDGRFRAAAAAEFGSDTAPVVYDAMPPAQAARGERIVRIGGEPPASGTGFARSERVAEQIEAGVRDGRLTLRLAGPSGERDVAIMPVRACPARFDVRPGEGVDANANGTYVQLTSGLVQSLDDVGLAALIAHELAHNILRHPQLLDRIGGGLLPGFSRAGRTMRATEEQADRVSLYILARAGYRMGDVVAFWRAFTRKHDVGFLSDRTHPDRRTRIAALEEEAARVERLRAGGQAVLPPAELLQSVDRNQRRSPSSPIAVSRPEA